MQGAFLGYVQDERYGTSAWMRRSGDVQDERYGTGAWMRRSGDVQEEQYKQTLGLASEVIQQTQAVQGAQLRYFYPINKIFSHVELFKAYAALNRHGKQNSTLFSYYNYQNDITDQGTDMTNTKMKPLALAFGASLLASVATTTVAAENPFASQSLESGYKVAMEGKCGEGKCGGKAESKEKTKEGKCGEGKAESKEKAKEGKCGEGKCGGKDKAATKAKEGKCGEGKCGGKS